tara:strand:- start:1470 stop:3239 length:1770 start_codon:yes stop_codon:yes gene_type:complete
MISSRIYFYICCVSTVLGLAIYANHLANPFQFDSVVFVEKNLDLHHPKNLFSLEFLKDEFLSRSFLRITMAWNAVLGGLNPFGYHLFNLLFHILNSILVFQTSLRIYRHLSRVGQDFSGKEFYYASCLTAILFLCHPIQTESVIYIASRSEILCGTFYLSIFLLFQVSLQPENRLGFWVRWIVVPFIILPAFFLGYSIKQSIITLPMMMFLYYLYGLPKTARALQFIKRFWVVLTILTLFAGVALLFKLLSDEGFLIGPSQAGEIIGRKAYMLSQPGVVVFYYLKILIFPINLNIDPDITKGTWSVSFFVASTFILLILTCAFNNSLKRITGFLTLWFFIVLSPSSSIITLLDLAAEHRTYLSTFGFFCLQSLGLVLLTRRIKKNKNRRKIIISSVVVLILLFSLASVERNYDWTSGLRLWEDTLKKSPNKTRPWMNVGHAHILLGNSDEALQYYQKAIDIDPYYFASQYNLGTLYEEKGDINQALYHYQFALLIDPYVAEVNGKLGEIYMKKGEYETAEQFLKKAVERNPKYASAFRNLGVLHYYYLKNKIKALAFFKRSLMLDPSNSENRLIRRLLAAEEGQRSQAR